MVDTGMSLLIWVAILEDYLMAVKLSDLKISSKKNAITHGKVCLPKNTQTGKSLVVLPTSYTVVAEATSKAMGTDMLLLKIQLVK